DLVGVHEAGVAHHVAAVGEIDGEHGAAAELDRRGAVLAQLRGRRLEVAPGIAPPDAPQPRRVDGDDVAEGAVLVARLLHDDAAILLDDVGLDLTGLALDELEHRAFAVEDLAARLLHAARAQRIGRARPTERWERALA